MQEGGTAVWGQQLDLSDYPELQGALVYLYAMARVEDERAAVNAFIGAPGVAKSATDSIASTTEWQPEHSRLELIDGNRLIYLIKEFLRKDALIGIPNRPEPHRER